MQPRVRIEAPSVPRAVAHSSDTATLAAVPPRRPGLDASSGGPGRGGWVRRLADGLRGLGRATQVESPAGSDPLLAFAAEGAPTPTTPGAGTTRTRRDCPAAVPLELSLLPSQGDAGASRLTDRPVRRGPPFTEMENVGAPAGPLRGWGMRGTDRRVARGSRPHR